ncbi:MAG: hypothetical protein RI900_1100 [Actinomycetota bacterium]
MCGRFVSTQSPEQLASFLDATVHSETLPPSHNVAPTNDVYAVVQSDGERRLESFRWGLVPSWAKDVRIGSSMINARAETVAEKPAFKALFRKHRLLVPMDGFFEWQAPGPDSVLDAKGKPRKTPMFIHSVDGSPLVAAGLWAAWREPDSSADAPWLHTCTIITTAANTLMSQVHDRMPVFLQPDDWDLWLDPTIGDARSLQPLLVPAPDGLLEMYAVGTDVNNVRNKGAELINPVGR